MTTTELPEDLVGATLTVPGLLDHAVERFGDREALVDRSVDPPVRLGWREYRDRARAAAQGFIAAGVQPGDRVSIWAPNTWEWPVVLVGLQMAGAAVVPLNTRYKGGEAAYILNRSRATALVTVQGFLGNDYVSMLEGHDLPHLKATVILRGDVPAGTVSCDDFIAAGATAEHEAELDRRLAALSPGDLSDILFTSGTTGAPKGVMCTHEQVVRAFESWASLAGLKAEDRYLCINPFFHSFGYKAGIVASLVRGAALVPQATFDVDEAIATIEAERISCLPGPPTIYQTIINHPAFERDKVASLRLAVTGASSVPVQLIEDMREILGFDTVLTAYGLTETSGIVTVSRHDTPIDIIANYSGRAIPGCEIRTVDESGSDVAAGEPGEVIVRGYQVMLGYFEAPEQTAETIDPDGWLHTGDIGILNPDGYLRITDRMKDMFITGGFNAYPAEIESILSTHPAIAASAVVGVPDERMGEVGFAYVQLRPGVSATPEELREWARENMANYKVPRTFRIVEEFPLNAAGKVLKYELRDHAAAEGNR
ncbi:MAG: FadD3 family acyl-CoA ligase [Microthrixaceae bacterium]|nr:FadD3 family acyl-CoA ligase [Microthrixaceae bacterium]